MFFLDTSFIIFALFIILLLLTGLYVWRRISSLESYNRILEKKVSHMKKETKELKELLYGDKDEAYDADVIMNKIFSADIMMSDCSIPVCTPISQVEKPNTTKITCNDDKCVITEDTSDIVQNIIAESTETKPVIHAHTFQKVVVQPVQMQQQVDKQQHQIPQTVIQNIDDTNDIESVLSDAVNGALSGPYNRKTLSKMNLDKLKEISTSMQLSTEGTKNILIDRILSNLTLE
jgi:hypothetical protein